ncbi:dynein regulatory complex protein 9 [Aphis craccivora]|uniref:Dynein regulatory complex protein 9 n=1 Tax=Aphis craccivora TaxID=307492 RepID=A0A6G0Z5T4_APHCR|nr:dynein regulatory complex protein 9 [Aphis craccivora]
MNFYRRCSADSVSDDLCEHLGTNLRATPSFDYSLDGKDPFADPRMIGTSELTVYEAFGAACVLDIWVNRIGMMDAMDGTGTLRDWDCEQPDVAAATVAADEEPPSDHTETASHRGKVTKFLAFVQDTLRLTVAELRSSGTFNELRQVNESMLNAVREERQLVADLAYNRNALNVLRVTIKDRKKHYNTDKWRIQSEIYNLDKQFKKTMKLIDLEADYIQAWENQCLNENDELLKEEANRLRQPIQHDSTSIAKNVIFPELIASIGPILEKWERMYDVQVGAIDVDTLTLENEEEELNESIQKLHDIINWMQGTINEFEERKHKYEERMRYEALINKMATKIQAFWRGTMVRRFLGQYKYLRKLFKKNKPKKGKSKQNKLKKK